MTNVRRSGAPRNSNRRRLELMATAPNAIITDLPYHPATPTDDFSKMNPTNDHEDESQVLAALGSTAASASDYESSVLRNATLQSAPQIVLPRNIISNNVTGKISRSSLTPCGEDPPSFPDLSSLAPSAASRKRKMRGDADNVPHVLSVLFRTRTQLQSALTSSNKSFQGNSSDERDEKRCREIDLLRMKEQIMLTYLTTVAGVKEEDGIIPQRNAGARSFNRRRSSDGGGDKYYGHDNLRRDETTNYASKRTTKEITSHEFGRNNKKHKEETTFMSDASSTNRLDRIKQGEDIDSTTVRSSAHVTKKQRRGKMMEMKSQMRVERGLSPLKTMEEERFDAEKARTRREERRKRRLKRQKAALGIDYESDEKQENEEEENELETKPQITGILKNKKSNNEVKSGKTVKLELDLDEQATANTLAIKNEDEQNSEVVNDDAESKKSGIRWANDDNSSELISDKQALVKQTQDDQTPPPLSTSPKKKREHTKVFCPVCQLILTLNHNDDASSPDDFLSKHIDKCQKTKGARGGGRTLRKRTKPAVIDTDEDPYEDGIHAVKEEDPFTPAENSYLDNEVEDDDHKPAARHNPKRGNSISPTPDEDTAIRKTPSSIDDMDEFDYEDRVDDWMENGVKNMRDMAERDTSEIAPGSVVYEGGLEIPAWINDRLFPYQRTGVRWMWELHCQGAGGVVGDEMGLGKTVQVSSFLGAMAANRLLDSVLIVAPATMLAHWLSELAVWAPGLRRIMIHRSGESDGVSRVVSTQMFRSLQKWLKGERRDRVNEAIDEKDYIDKGADSFCGTGYAVVTTYESIRRLPDVWTSHQWSYVVLDEGQKIRNPDADVTLACKRLRTPHRLLLSGTPIQNDLRELWSLFDFIFPGRLGTLPAFEAEFAVPIKRGGYSNASPMQVQLAYRCAIVLRDLINPYLLRRMKKDIEEVNRMPGKTEQVLFCRLSSKQRYLYEEYLRSDEVTSVMRGSTQLLKAVTVLRKICNHPDLLAGPNGTINSTFEDANSSSSDDDDLYEDDKLVEHSGKLQVLSKILPLWHKQGHRVIIFCQWKKMLNIIESFTRQQGWKFARMDGNTNVAARQRLVDSFNNDESYFCMLMTTKTGGVGLNVTGANRVLLYDPDWNPQTDAQARERAWRFGQKKDVTVYRLITAGTIEEKIYQRQIFKTALTNQVLQDPKQRRLFSQKDLRDLFTLKADSKDATETGVITKGGGVVDMSTTDEPNESSGNRDDQQADNTNTLEVVIKSKGLCGVFDHDFVENSSAKKPISVLEMEENAKKVAMKAALALKESSENQDRFEPTWTGSNETNQPIHQRNMDADASFGGANSAGFSTTGARKMASSGSLLVNLQNKRMQIASSNQTPRSGNEPNSRAKKDSGLLARLRKYISRKSSNGGPTTRDLLNEFSDVPDCDADMFRNTLKAAAVIKNGRWIMKEG